MKTREQISARISELKAKIDVLNTTKAEFDRIYSKTDRLAFVVETLEWVIGNRY